METRLLKTLIFCLLLFSAFEVSAQKKLLITDADTIIATAKQQLDLDRQPEGKLREFADKHAVKGEFNIDFSLNDKGQVVSVFFQSKPDLELKTITQFREFLNEYTFNFKTPKGRKYKFNYQFNL